MSSRERLKVVYSSNDGYVRHLAASMCSLFDRNREFSEIQVFVLAMGLSEASKAGLAKIAEGYGRKLEIIPMDDLESRFSHPVDCGGYDVSIMLRLFMGEMLPPSVDKVLYLDCDTIVLQSLKGLWSRRLGTHILEAVMEPTIYPEVRRSIDLEPCHAYYNSGVLLVNLARWRAEGVQERLLDFWKSRGGKLFASDQDVLNGALKGQIGTLPPKYNFFTNYRYFSYSALVEYGPTYQAVTKEEFSQAKRHPVIVHYMGDERPWIAGNLNHYRRAYEKYLALTPWAGTKKEPGKRLYMLAYHGLNYVTAVCPAIRWEISGRMGMKFVERRKKG